MMFMMEKELLKIKAIKRKVNTSNESFVEHKNAGKRSLWLPGNSQIYIARYDNGIKQQRVKTF